MSKKITLENIFACRGQIMLAEKMKGKDSCHCGLCVPPRMPRNHSEILWDAPIAPDHYDTIKIFVPMSKRKFKSLCTIYAESVAKKEKNIIRRKQELAMKGIELINGVKHKINNLNFVRLKRRVLAGNYRLYPLHKSVYDEFAGYLYRKFGEPQFHKKKKNITGANWGAGITQYQTSNKHGRYAVNRTVGVQLYKGTFEFCVDDGTFRLKKEVKEKFRKKNTKKFRKKLGKMI
jgi:hypothetical protein